MTAEWNARSQTSPGWGEAGALQQTSQTISEI